MRRNASREKVWRGMSEREKAEYLSTTTDKGNKRYAVVERARTHTCLCIAWAKRY